MKSKTLFVAAILMILISSFSFCFAEGEKKDVNLGNEISRSIDKTSGSINKVISSNVVGGTKNVVEGGIKTVENVVMDTGNMVKDGAMNAGNMVKDGAMSAGNMINKDAEYVKDAGNYNAVRTTTEVSRSGIDKDTMTTWMWITLIAATTIIIAAIWYYVTQIND